MQSTDVCVAICTRGRLEGVRDAVASVLIDPDESVRLIVVDQNDDDRLVEAFAEFESDDRLIHHRVDFVGAGRARNAAVGLLGGEVICFTDDDCTVPSGWARDLTQMLTHDPDADMVFCSVSGSVDEGRSGYTPVHVVDRPLRHRAWDRTALAQDLGIGAGMAIRRRALAEIGGFDPLMGPGGTFPSADDREVAIRLLHRGRHVLQTPTPVVIHHGFRSDGPDTRALTKRDYLALGAMFAKFMRMSPIRSGSHLIGFLAWSATDVVRSSVRMRRPAALGKLWWTFVGVWSGARHDVDDTSWTYRELPEKP